MMFPEAVMYLYFVIPMEAWQAAALLQAGKCRERLGDVDGAVRAVRDVLAREPDNSSALNTLGYLFADHGRDLAEHAGLVQQRQPQIVADLGLADRTDPAVGVVADEARRAPRRGRSRASQACASSRRRR